MRERERERMLTRWSCMLTLVIYTMCTCLLTCMSDVSVYLTQLVKFRRCSCSNRVAYWNTSMQHCRIDEIYESWWFHNEIAPFQSVMKENRQLRCERWTCWDLDMHPVISHPSLPHRPRPCPCPPWSYLIPPCWICVSTCWLVSHADWCCMAVGLNIAIREIWR